MPRPLRPRRPPLPRPGVRLRGDWGRLPGPRRRARTAGGDQAARCVSPHRTSRGPELLNPTSPEELLYSRAEAEQFCFLLPGFSTCWHDLTAPVINPTNQPAAREVIPVFLAAHRGTIGRVHVRLSQFVNEDETISPIVEAPHSAPALRTIDGDKFAKARVIEVGIQ